MKEIQKHGKEISLDELKVIQMDILQAIDGFCKKNSIRYSMSNGTMLGAIRHKGYIPWDDDIDIYLLRDDFEKLMCSFPDVYNGCYCISSLERDALWDKPYAKAYDNRTIVVEKADYDGSFGVNIDIFPVDEVPDDEDEWKLYDVKRRMIYQKYNKLLASVPFNLSPIGFLKWLKWNFPKWFTTRRKMAERVDLYSKRWRGKGYSRVFECCQGVFQKKPFKKEVFFHLKDYPFEDRFFMGFENYDEYLHNGFGNYMELPPVEKRVTHHRNNVYWK